MLPALHNTSEGAPTRKATVAPEGPIIEDQALVGRTMISAQPTHNCTAVWRSYLDDLAHGHPLRQMAPPRGQRGLEFDAVGEQRWHRDAMIDRIDRSARRLTVPQP